MEQILSAHGEHEAYFYSTHQGLEIDLVLPRGSEAMWGFEFKTSDAPKRDKSMTLGVKELGLDHLWVVYPGNETYPLSADNRITALPLHEAVNLDLGNRT